MATWLIAYRPESMHGARPAPEVVEADDVRYAAGALVLTKQQLVVFTPRTVIVRRIPLERLATLCRLRETAAGVSAAGPAPPVGHAPPG